MSKELSGTVKIAMFKEGDKSSVVTSWDIEDVTNASLESKQLLCKTFTNMFAASLNLIPEGSAFEIIPIETVSKSSSETPSVVSSTPVTAQSKEAVETKEHTPAEPLMEIHEEPAQSEVKEPVQQPIQTVSKTQEEVSTEAPEKAPEKTPESKFNPLFLDEVKALMPNPSDPSAGFAIYPGAYNKKLWIQALLDYLQRYKKNYIIWASNDSDFAPEIKKSFGILVKLSKNLPEGLEMISLITQGPLFLEQWLSDNEFSPLTNENATQAMVKFLKVVVLAANQK